MNAERFTELLDDKIFELAKELRDEHGASNIVINQESSLGRGRIVIEISDKEATHG